MCLHSCPCIFPMLAYFCFDRVHLTILILLVWLCSPNKNLARTVICNCLCSWPVLERQHQFRVLKWEFCWQLWHWARSSEIMKQTSGRNPNPPWLDAGINGLIKASLFLLVDRFTRNEPDLLYTFPSLACRHLPALAGVSALTASMWFGRCWRTDRSEPQISMDLCVPMGSADFASTSTVIHWVIWVNIEENNLYVTYRRHLI